MTSRCDNFDTFVALSAWLTGFDKIDLEGTGLAQTYFNQLQQNITQDSLNAFLLEGRHVLEMAQSDVDGAKARTDSHLMQNSSFNNLGKQVILMWYTGQWCVNGSGTLDNATQIDAQSYVEGLMWDAADAHPPGAKQPGYGSWAYVPTSVDTFNLSMEGEYHE